MTPAILESWIGDLRISQGRLAGERFSVLPWQRRFLRGAFRPGVQTAALSVARGVGKTTFTAAIGAAALAGPLVQQRGEVIAVASSFPQARLLFEHLAAFLRPLIALEPKRWRVQDSSNRAMIEDRQTGARIRAIGSDPRRAHGLAPVLVLMDEPAQYESAKSDSMYSALLTAMGKLRGARLIALGTRPADEGHWFSRLMSGGSDYVQMHAAREKDPPFQRRTWVKANPSLDRLPDLEAAIRSEAAKAKRDPNLLAAFKSLRLNRGTPDVLRPHLLDAGTWERIESAAEQQGESIWGVDLGATASMSAICAYWPNTGRLEALGAFPGVPDLAERGRRDGVDKLYVQMAERGELLQLGARVIPVPELLQAARDRFGPPVAIATDRWRIGELEDAMLKTGLYAPLVARGQGFFHGGEDVRLFRSACLDGSVKPVESLLLRAAMSEAVVLTDPAGNSKLAKNTEAGRRRRARDDAAAAAILAVAEGARRAARPVPQFAFDHIPLSGLAA